MHSVIGALRQVESLKTAVEDHDGVLDILRPFVRLFNSGPS
jgi:hypothetical protein